MSRLHEIILNELAGELAPIIAKGTDPYFYLFENHRMVRGQPTGLRLTHVGSKLMSKHFSGYAFKHEFILTPGRLLKLDEGMTWPYYVSRNIIRFYNSEDNAWFRLHQENVDSFLYDI